jgi:dTMP kinase
MWGSLIAVEGIDGAGKTTIARHIYGFLTNHGCRCALFKEPSDSVYGKIIRNINVQIDPDLELVLFLKDREIDVRERILPALRKGLIVIMDRYYYSNVAYQSARGLNAKQIKKLNEKIAPKPDLVILLDLSASTALERIKRRKQRSVFEELEFLELVRRKFLEIADEKTVIIDAERELDIVKREVEQIVLYFANKTLGDVGKRKNRIKEKMKHYVRE